MDWKSDFRELIGLINKKRELMVYFIEILSLSFHIKSSRASLILLEEVLINIKMCITVKGKKGVIQKKTGDADVAGDIGDLNINEEMKAMD